MKKNKMEVLALSLMLFVLCYAFYDCNKSENEQNIVLSNELFSMIELKSKNDITIEMLSLPAELLSNEQEETEENNNNAEVYSISLEVEENSIPYNEIISNQVVNYALQFVGNPYVYGGNSLTNGTDCSGFTKLILDNYNNPTNKYKGPDDYIKINSGTSVGLDNIMPGDLVFSGYDGVVGHVAIYIGDNQLVHALNSNVGIVVTDLYIMPILDVRRVI